MTSSLLTVTPLTVDSVREVFKNTSNLRRLCIYYLNIPHYKSSDAAATAAEYYVNHSRVYRRWRWIIWGLDQIGDTALADSIMSCAEPSTGMWSVYMNDI